MVSNIPTSEGLIPFRGYRTWYRMIGDMAQTQAGTFPVLLVHGRPVSHESLKPLEWLAQTGRPVVFYDQLGCGNSDRPDDPSIWEMSLFVEELDVVRRKLGLEQVHLLGHSWGGMIAMEYGLTQPHGIVSLTLASASSSRALSNGDIEGLREKLPPYVQETLRKHEEAGTTDDPTYQEADKVFALRHIFRKDPWPKWLMQSMRRPQKGMVDMEGWDIRPRLRNMTIPTLVTCGRFDICTPAHARLIYEAIPQSELAIFEESSHYPHGEETNRFLAVLHNFMTRREHELDGH
ncbi:MAG: proline iminopeptidase-family hydrolase [Thermodesulfobacteriota bacterium]|nr:proline iminopeptidase-family hydrolase [Thermodesulfobacteriota bacterium]